MEITRANLKSVKEDIVKKYLGEKELKQEENKIKQKVENIQKSLIKKKPIEVVFDE